MKQGNSITRSGPWWINHVVSAYNVSVDGFKRRRDFVMTRGENCSKEYCRIDLRAGGSSASWQRAASRFVGGQKRPCAGALSRGAFP